MRQYQRRAVAKLRTAYNSKSPLRWFDCKVLTRGYFTAYVEASPRERKLANRRMYKAIGRTFVNLGTTVKQAAKAILNSSKPGEIVLDLFAGGGSTLMAADATGRICYTMELDERYVDVVRKRYAKSIGREEDWEEATPEVQA